MFRLTDDDAQTLRDAIAHAGDRAAVLTAVKGIYDELAAEVAAQNPRCDASGRCCRFEAYGHSLFVSTLEMIHFKAAVQSPPRAGFDGTGCPWQINGKCEAREARPLGCRIYYCDGSDDWQHGVTERLLAKLRQLHDALDVPYLYAEWREMLSAARLSPPVEKRNATALPVVDYRP